MMMKLLPFCSAVLFAAYAGRSLKNTTVAAVTIFMEDAKASGIVRQAFDDAGLIDLIVAPPGNK
jgi:hypothetical protein